MSKKIRLNQIRIDGGTQPRVALNQDTVAEYAEAMRDGADFPPVTVYHDGTDHWLADGFHRYHAAEQASLKWINAEVTEGTLRDAILHSVGANATHGLRRSNEDKRRAVLTLLQDTEWSQWSDREIAKACGVSHPTVAKYREEINLTNSVITGKVSSYNASSETVHTGNFSSMNQPERTYIHPKTGEPTTMNTAGIAQANSERAAGDPVDPAGIAPRSQPNPYSLAPSPQPRLEGTTPNPLHQDIIAFVRELPERQRDFALRELIRSRPIYLSPYWRPLTAHTGKEVDHTALRMALNVVRRDLEASALDLGETPAAPPPISYYPPGQLPPNWNEAPAAGPAIGSEPPPRYDTEPANGHAPWVPAAKSDLSLPELRAALLALFRLPPSAGNQAILDAAKILASPPPACYTPPAKQ